jgi:hypothetical protein
VRIVGRGIQAQAWETVEQRVERQLGVDQLSDADVRGDEPVESGSGVARQPASGSHVSVVHASPSSQPPGRQSGGTVVLVVDEVLVDVLEEDTTEGFAVISQFLTRTP